MERGDIYLAPFTYADLQGSKRRPVCVVSSAAFNIGADVIVAMVTSSRQRLATPGRATSR
jgi:mRNA-degrading endonuclease toxin of MazEF toxin-antitoxin module